MRMQSRKLQTQPRELLIEKFIKPSEIVKTSYGCVVIERWYNKIGEMHSINNQPASIWYENGKILSKYWYKNGIRYKKESYYKHNTHSIVIYSTKGTVIINWNKT